MDGLFDLEVDLLTGKKQTLRQSKSKAAKAARAKKAKAKAKSAKAAAKSGRRKQTAADRKKKLAAKGARRAARAKKKKARQAAQGSRRKERAGRNAARAKRRAVCKEREKEKQQETAKKARAGAGAKSKSNSKSNPKNPQLCQKIAQSKVVRLLRILAEELGLSWGEIARIAREGDQNQKSSDNKSDGAVAAANPQEEEPRRRDVKSSTSSGAADTSDSTRDSTLTFLSTARLLGEFFRFQDGGAQAQENSEKSASGDSPSPLCIDYGAQLPPERRDLTDVQAIRSMSNEYESELGQVKKEMAALKPDLTLLSMLDSVDAGSGLAGGPDSSGLAAQVLEDAMNNDSRIIEGTDADEDDEGLMAKAKRCPDDKALQISLREAALRLEQHGKTAIETADNAREVMERLQRRLHKLLARRQRKFMSCFEFVQREISGVYRELTGYGAGGGMVGFWRPLLLIVYALCRIVRDVLS